MIKKMAIAAAVVIVVAFGFMMVHAKQVTTNTTATMLKAS